MVKFGIQGLRYGCELRVQPDSRNERHRCCGEACEREQGAPVRRPSGLRWMCMRFATTRLFTAREVYRQEWTGLTEGERGPHLVGDEFYRLAIACVTASRAQGEGS